MLEPFGDRWADLRSGIVASTIANVNRDPETKPDPFSPGDFIFNLVEEEKVEDPDASWKRNKELFQMMAEQKP